MWSRYSLLHYEICWLETASSNLLPRAKFSMFDTASAFIETISEYLVPSLFSLVGILIGGVVGWMLRSKIGRGGIGSHMTKGVPALPKQSSPIRPINSSESQVVAEINLELEKIEEDLALFPARLNAFSLQEKLSSILRRLTLIRHSTRGFAAPKPPTRIASIAAPEPPILEPMVPRTFSQDFADMYNAARDDREVRNEFWAKFQFDQLGNRNTTDQRLGRTNAHDFRTSESMGDFIAVKNPENGIYLVVPSFTIAVDDTSFRFGGLEAAFSCDFSPGSTYQKFKVIGPAEFSRDGERWFVKSKGELLLVA